MRSGKQLFVLLTVGLLRSLRSSIDFDHHPHRKRCANGYLSCHALHHIIDSSFGGSQATFIDFHHVEVTIRHIAYEGRSVRPVPFKSWRVDL